MLTVVAPVANAIDAFSWLPGIGPKTAARLAFYLLRGGGSWRRRPSP